MDEPALAEVAARLTAIEETLTAFQQLAASLLALAGRAPVHMDVAHLAVERLEFKVDSVDVGELSGELNIGLTSRLNLGHGPENAGTSPDIPEAPPAGALTAADTAPAQVRPIWPPEPGGSSGGDDGDTSVRTPGAGTQQS